MFLFIAWDIWIAKLIYMPNEQQSKSPEQLNFLFVYDNINIIVFMPFMSFYRITAVIV